MEAAYTAWLQAVAANLVCEPTDLDWLDSNLRSDYLRGLDPFDAAQQYL